MPESTRLAPAPLEELAHPAPPGHLDIGLVGDVYWPEPDPVHAPPWPGLESATLIVANLESPITNRNEPAAQKPHIHRSLESVEDIFDQRFVLCLANNHIMDHGLGGLRDTMSVLDKAGIAYAGAGLDLDAAETPRILSVTPQTTAALICAADPRFDPAGPNHAGTCPAHPEALTEMLHSVRHRADLIIVSLHMGLEHVSVPSARQIRLAEACLREGAHIVHFHHSHQSSGAAFGGHGAVLFGTGNYIFPYKPGSSPPGPRRTGAWCVRFDATAGRIAGLSFKPMTLDHTGLPRVLQGPQAAREIERLRRLGRGMLQGPHRHVLRLKELLNPAFLRHNARCYWSLTRRLGPRFVVKSAAAGIRTHFGRGR